MRKQLIILIAALVAAAICSRLALAAGEPKNEIPFTAHATPDWFERYAAAHPYGRELGRQLTTATTASDSSLSRDLLVGGSVAGGILLIGAGAFEASRRRGDVPMLDA
jgi:hypothetical protein